MIEQFLKDISPKGNIEFSTIGADGCKVISKDLALSNKESNIYFLGGIKDGLYKRASDSDVEYVSYIRIDLDIYNEAKENYNVELSTEEIKEKIEELKETLDSLSYFKERKYIAFSGKGCHVYYTAESIQINPTDFRLAMTRIYREWDNKITDVLFVTDKATVNLGRIMRLPTSINQKNGQECEIVYNNLSSSKFISLLPNFAKAEKKDKVERDRLKQIEFEEKVAKYGDINNDDNLYNLILDLPAFEISQLILPQFKYTGRRNFLSNNMQGNRYTAFYYSEDKNCIINGGSSHYNWGDVTSGYDSFQLVKKSFNWTNKETFSHFRRLLNK